MRGRLILGSALVALLLLGTSCGGGGGGGGREGVTVADLDGGWFGPTGTTGAGATSVGTGTGGMLADAGGNALDFNVNGVGTGVQGAFFVVDPLNGVFAFSRTDGRTGTAIMSPDRRHLLYIDSAGTFGAWQKDATALAGPYDFGMIANSSWSAVLCDVSPTAEPVDSGTTQAQIDGVGMFMCDRLETDLDPIALLESVNGQYEGDFKVDGEVSARPILLLITPDLEFLAVQFSAGPTFPDESSFGAWSR